MKSKKTIRSFGQLIVFLESLEMLDMSYSVTKFVTSRNGEPVFSWEIEYEMGAPLPAYAAANQE